MTPTGIEAQVCADIARRQRLGLAKYGVSVADNPLGLLAWLNHAYEEALDQAVYLKRAMAEISSLIENHSAPQKSSPPLKIDPPTGVAHADTSPKAIRTASELHAAVYERSDDGG